jgi:hypothetical protein
MADTDADTQPQEDSVLIEELDTQQQLAHEMDLVGQGVLDSDSQQEAQRPSSLLPPAAASTAAAASAEQAADSDPDSSATSPGSSSTDSAEEDEDFEQERADDLDLVEPPADGAGSTSSDSDGQHEGTQLFQDFSFIRPNNCTRCGSRADRQKVLRRHPPFVGTAGRLSRCAQCTDFVSCRAELCHPYGEGEAPSTIEQRRFLTLFFKAVQQERVRRLAADAKGKRAGSSSNGSKSKSSKADSSSSGSKDTSAAGSSKTKRNNTRASSSKAKNCWCCCRWCRCISSFVMLRSSASVSCVAV